MLSKETPTAIVICKYLALIGPPNSKCNVKFLAFNEAANGNCNL